MSRLGYEVVKMKEIRDGQRRGKVDGELAEFQFEPEDRED